MRLLKRERPFFAELVQILDEYNRSDLTGHVYIGTSLAYAPNGGVEIYLRAHRMIEVPPNLPFGSLDLQLEFCGWKWSGCGHEVYPPKRLAHKDAYKQYSRIWEWLHQGITQHCQSLGRPKPHFKLG